jgi:hypothetical protein
MPNATCGFGLNFRPLDIAAETDVELRCRFWEHYVFLYKGYMSIAGGERSANRGSCVHKTVVFRTI